MKKIWFLLLLVVLSIIMFLTCEIDHGLYPVNYQISGNIYFFKSTPPENTDRIEIFALKEFPPKDPQNFLYLGRSGALAYQQGNAISYEVQVSRTSYQLIGLLWKEKGEDWNLTGLMGFYTGGLDSFFPDSVVITKEKPVVENIDIYANWDRVSKEATISGNITYAGAWPDDTQLLLLAIYQMKPTNDLSYILFENIDYAQPVFVDSSAYRLKVNSGVYNYIALFWIGKNIKNLTDLIELGFYSDLNNPDQPGKVVISANEKKQHVDIHVNFDDINFPRLRKF
jgi:hypothetical protein